MTRLVIDASVLLSGVVSRSDSPPAVLLDALRRGVYEAIACPRLLEEFAAGLRNPYFAARVGATEARDILEAIRSAAVMLDDPVAPPRVVRDPDDDYLVALAQAADADAVVSGDRDLLDEASLVPPAIDARTACVSLGLLES